MLRKELIGHTFVIVRPNGTRLNILIEDAADKFSFYRKMGLDVFDDSGNVPSKKLNHNYFELKDMTAAELKEYAKKNGIAGTTKKDILNAIREV